MKVSNSLIYYGWLNSFNSAQNGWDNEKVAQELARYTYLVFGDGIQNPSHGDYSNTQVIIARIIEINPACVIFGYVTINQSYNDFCTKADQWDDLGVDGIFMDEAGYDYGTVSTNGRQAFNDKVDFVHGLQNANGCFVNSWKPRYVLGTEDDTNNYPNSTWNPQLLESNLNEYDIALLESCAVDSSGNYESGSQWFSRVDEWLDYRGEFGIDLVASSCISDSDQNGQAKFNFIYTSAMIASLEGVGSSDLNYGASSATSKMWQRPSTCDIGFVYPEIQIANSGSKYFRYVLNGRLEIDFTTGSQSSSIISF